MTNPDRPSPAAVAPGSVADTPAPPTSGQSGSRGGGSDALATLPSIALPTGGGAIRGIGESFTAHPSTGTGSMTVPIATSPGRAGFGPTLSLEYDSADGSGTITNI
jgi:hypothetical protein